MAADDRGVMHRVARGDETAFTELVSRYQDRLFTVAHRLLGNRADAEDAVQRAFLNCHLNARSYDRRWQVSTWLYRILTNICVDELRRRRVSAPLGREQQARGRPDEAAPRLDVRRALERVPTEARLLLALRYVDGLTYAELARVRGVSINTVKSQLARGKSILRKALG
ncbi:MAG: sigma-70 family RNA polymerase sigma factor [Candidatus Rokubacteria bacterium]|nr:sigma-70 family RNA polymerase sigma factor [Candidatus Rokubacteria bacterium]